MNGTVATWPGWTFAPHGQSGTEVSALFPEMASCVDDLALIRGMHTSHSNHFNATLGLHTGSFTVAPYEFGRPADTGADDRDFVVLYNSSNMSTDPMGFEFTEARTSALISGPLASVIAVRREHP